MSVLLKILKMLLLPLFLLYLPLYTLSPYHSNKDAEYDNNNDNNNNNNLQDDYLRLIVTRSKARRLLCKS